MFGSRVPFPLLSAGQRVTSLSPEAQLPPSSGAAGLGKLPSLPARGPRGAVQGAGRAARRPGRPAAPGQRLCPLFQRTTRGAAWLTGAPGRSGSRYAVSPPVSRRTAPHTPTLGDAPCLRRRPGPSRGGPPPPPGAAPVHGPRPRATASAPPAGRTAAPLRGPGPGADTGHRPPCAPPAPRIGFALAEASSAAGGTAAGPAAPPARNGGVRAPAAPGGGSTAGEAGGEERTGGFGRLSPSEIFQPYLTRKYGSPEGKRLTRALLKSNSSACCAGKIALAASQHAGT